jgi:dCTP deaminase
VQPRFRGTITLELANLGTVPLVLYVGMRVAQVSFFVVTDDPSPPLGFDDGYRATANPAAIP